MVPVERYSEPGKEEGFFFAPEGEAPAEFGSVKTKAHLDVSKFYKGTDSQTYLESVGKFDEPIPARLRADVRRVVNEAKKNWPKDTANFPQNPKTIRELAEWEGLIDPSPLYDAKQSTAAKLLSEKGYTGADWSEEDDLTPHQYQVFDRSVVRKGKP